MAEKINKFTFTPVENPDKQVTKSVNGGKFTFTPVSKGINVPETGSPEFQALRKYAQEAYSTEPGSQSRALPYREKDIETAQKIEGLLSKAGSGLQQAAQGVEELPGFVKWPARQAIRMGTKLASQPFTFPGDLAENIGPALAEALSLGLVPQPTQEQRKETYQQYAPKASLEMEGSDSLVGPPPAETFTQQQLQDIAPGMLAPQNLVEAAADDVVTGIANIMAGGAKFVPAAFGYSGAQAGSSALGYLGRQLEKPFNKKVKFEPVFNIVGSLLGGIGGQMAPQIIPALNKKVTDLYDKRNELIKNKSLESQVAYDDLTSFKNYIEKQSSELSWVKKAKRFTDDVLNRFKKRRPTTGFSDVADDVDKLRTETGVKIEKGLRLGDDNILEWVDKSVPTKDLKFDKVSKWNRFTEVIDDITEGTANEATWEKLEKQLPNTDKYKKTLKNIMKRYKDSEARNLKKASGPIIPADELANMIQNANEIDFENAMPPTGERLWGQLKTKLYDAIEPVYEAIPEAGKANAEGASIYKALKNRPTEAFKKEFSKYKGLIPESTLGKAIYFGLGGSFATLAGGAKALGQFGGTIGAMGLLGKSLDTLSILASSKAAKTEIMKLGKAIAKNNPAQAYQAVRKIDKIAAKKKM